jgi:hypothetical protein
MPDCTRCEQPFNRVTKDGMWVIEGMCVSCLIATGNTKCIHCGGEIEKSAGARVCCDACTAPIGGFSHFALRQAVKHNTFGPGWGER